MPELPDIEVYREGLRRRIVGERLTRFRIISPFVVRTYEPPIEAVDGKRVQDIRRIGKRLVLALDEDLFLILHLMIAGRLRWEPRQTRPPRKISLAAMHFPRGTLLLTEASKKKRASIHLVRGQTALAAHDPGGIEPFEVDAATFHDRLVRENHTVKRSLTDPRLFAGIGNAYSDEILHAAGLSPVKLTQRLTGEEIARLYRVTQSTLRQWTDVLLKEFGERFPGPGEITAFRPDFAVHGRFGKPCPACGTKVQRIRYAENETNYCPRCQTEGRVLADRSLSRLLKEDWPRTIEELEGDAQ
ncbi:MAG TPA: DNA-formamidopyrimidine glycosylase family protein [Phycisphaerae bacterium]|nr:DNA-formamidopyrimidine glycosylase family protein [Phycisphaerae bacterium]